MKKMLYKKKNIYIYIYIIHKKMYIIYKKNGNYMQKNNILYTK